MNEQFTALRIVTNGQKFRIQGLLSDSWEFLSHYQEGSELFFGCVPLVGIKDFPSKLAAIDYIKEQFGNTGLNKLNNTWIPC